MGGFGFGGGPSGGPSGTLKIQGTGGTIITDTAGDRIIHYITNPAHNFVADATISDARVVVVGGAGGNGGGSGGGDGGAGFALPWFTPAVGVAGKVAGGGGGAGYQETNSPNSPSALSGTNVPTVEGGAGRGGFGPENDNLSMNPFFSNGPGGGENATAGTGSGGGGSRNNTPGGGGAGGSGCVIISYGPSL